MRERQREQQRKRANKKATAIEEEIVKISDQASGPEEQTERARKIRGRSETK